MNPLTLDAGRLKVNVTPDGKECIVTSSDWFDFRLGPLACRLRVDGKAAEPSSTAAALLNEEQGPALQITSDFSEIGVRLVQTFSPYEKDALLLRSELLYTSEKPTTLNEVRLLEGEAVLGEEHQWARLLENRGYSSTVRVLGKVPEKPRETPEQMPVEQPPVSSQTYWVAYNPHDKMALLIGYLTFDRWMGTVSTQWMGERQPVRWSTGFDGGDLLVDSGQKLQLEEIVFLVGDDPWQLLERYGDLVKEKYHLQPLPHSPVSWCSWYPYRLGVTEDLILANAAMAAQRLKALGLTIVEVDLGWEKNYLPSAYEENDQFPHGLKWLSERLKEMRFVLGAWKAPWVVSEYDSLVKEHPEWLHRDEEGKPLAMGEWFWQPHGQTYALDLTHPGAQEWLRTKITSLAERGAGYFKLDFLSIVSSSKLRRRHNPRMVAGGGFEAARLGSRIIHEAIKSVNPNAIALNCNGVEMPGIGYFELLYTCDDTGNTGYVGWEHLAQTYTSVACHLFKNQRWGIIQPSCLCVGLPGTLEEARCRATATFLCGGQVDISDDLTSLPEDRWAVLLATLPPLGKSAKPLDLFEPMSGTGRRGYGHPKDYERVKEELDEVGVSCVWHLHVQADWDEWDLLALFNYETKMKSFQVPLERLGLDADQTYWVYEFWSGQFLGEIPNPTGVEGNYRHPYTHPGDTRALLRKSPPGMLNVDFFGPAVKLLVLRRTRTHPWVVGTSFHQSSGIELRNVKWDERQRCLRGEIYRPVVQAGQIIFAGVRTGQPVAQIGERIMPLYRGAFGSWVLPIVTSEDVLPWELKFKEG